MARYDRPGLCLAGRGRLLPFAMVSFADGDRASQIELEVSMGPFAAGWTEQDIEAVLERAEPQELLYVPIVVSMNAADLEREWAEKICLRLAGHPHFNVRGNALLGSGHIARTCRMLNTQAAAPLIASALQDQNEFVRGHAMSAAEDLGLYLGVVAPGMDANATGEG